MSTSRLSPVFILVRKGVGDMASRILLGTYDKILDSCLYGGFLAIVTSLAWPVVLCATRPMNEATLAMAFWAVVIPAGIAITLLAGVGPAVLFLVGKAQAGSSCGRLEADMKNALKRAQQVSGEDTQVAAASPLA